MKIPVKLSFCATGQGGGVDPSCGKGGGGNLKNSGHWPLAVQGKMAYAHADSMKANESGKPEDHAAAAAAHNAAAKANDKQGNLLTASEHQAKAAAHIALAGPGKTIEATSAGTNVKFSAKVNPSLDEAKAMLKGGRVAGSYDVTTGTLHLWNHGQVGFGLAAVINGSAGIHGDEKYSKMNAIGDSTPHGSGNTMFQVDTPKEMEARFRGIEKFQAAYNKRH